MSIVNASQLSLFFFFMKGAALSITCNDEDTGRNGMCSVSLTNDKSGWFSFSNNSLFVKGSVIDYDSLSEEERYVTLTLNAVDQSDEFPRFTSQATIFVQVSSFSYIQSMIHTKVISKG